MNRPPVTNLAYRGLQQEYPNFGYGMWINLTKIAQSYL
jgi:hypothetical protein